MTFAKKAGTLAFHKPNIQFWWNDPVRIRTVSSIPICFPGYPQASDLRHTLPPTTFTTQRISLSSVLPRSFSTTSSGGLGRSRKRKRLLPRTSPASLMDQNDTRENSRRSKETSRKIKSNNDVTSDETLSYPKGQPWRVLWPQPHGSAARIDLKQQQRQSRRIPRFSDFRRAWALYKETWEDGISGRPSAAKLERLKREELARKLAEAEADVEASTVSLKEGGISDERERQLKEIGDNAARNIRLIRKDAQQLLDQAKDRTGIHTQDDLKAVAAQMMQTVTECIQEFMAGYRQGRDQEIDKMLNEYFKNDDGDSTDKNDPTDPNGKQQQKRRKRKPKRGIPRD